MKEIEFGSCIQYSEEGKPNCYNKQPIRWLVLTEQDDRQLIISKDCLYFEPYNDWFSHGSAIEICWTDSTLRHFMNNGKYWFNFKENSRILDGEDKFFLLSLEEVRRYMPNNIDRQAKPTEFAVNELKKKGAFVLSHEDNCQWWLMDKSQEDNCSFMYVGADGRINRKGALLNTKAIGVRPAMWILL